MIFQNLFLIVIMLLFASCSINNDKLKDEKIKFNILHQNKTEKHFDSIYLKNNEHELLKSKSILTNYFTIASSFSDSGLGFFLCAPYTEGKLLPWFPCLCLCVLVATGVIGFLIGYY